MSLSKIFHFLAVVSLVLTFACDGKKPSTVPDVPEVIPPLAIHDAAVADTLTVQPQDGVVVESAPDTLQNSVPPAAETQPVKKAPLQKSQEQPSSESPQAPSPQARHEPEVPATAFQEGTYRLMSVQGDGLPLVMDMTTDCDTRLLHGLLILKDGLFHFESQTEEACKNKLASREKHEAEGSYRLEGTQIYLNIRHGDALGNASGVLEEGSQLRLQQIGNGEERQEVDWVFARQ